MKTILLLILCLAVSLARGRHGQKNTHHGQQKNNHNRRVKKSKTQTKWNNYRTLEDKPCEIKTGVLGYAIEFTHSEDSNADNGYLVGIKSTGTHVELTPEHMVFKNVHDMTLMMKKVRTIDIATVNTPVIWKDQSVKMRCFQVVTNKHASLDQVMQTSTQEPLSIDTTEVNLCFDSDAQRDDWAQSLVAMKECTRGQRVLAHSQELARKRLVQHQAVLENKWSGIDKGLEHRREKKSSQTKVYLLQRKLKMLRHETQHIKQKLRAQRQLETCPHLKKEEDINEMIDLLHPQFQEMKAFRKESDDSMKHLDHTLNHFNHHHHSQSPADHLRYIQSSLDKELSVVDPSASDLHQPPVAPTEENKVPHRHERRHPSSSESAEKSEPAAHPKEKHVDEEDEQTEDEHNQQLQQQQKDLEEQLQKLTEHQKQLNWDSADEESAEESSKQDPQNANHNSEEDDENIKDEDQYDEKNINEQEDEDDMEDFNQENKLTPQEKKALEELVGKQPAKSHHGHKKKAKSTHQFRFAKKKQDAEQAIDQKINSLIYQLSNN